MLPFVVIPLNNYYPFGLSFGEEFGEEQGIQDFKYNGKKLDKTHGLNQYDYAARFMDLGMIRFTTVDPLAEKYYSISPYAYVHNNPMNAIDMKGDITTVLNLGYGTNQHMLFLFKKTKENGCIIPLTETMSLQEVVVLAAIQEVENLMI